ncbi:copper chaperone [Didymella pomorum]
MVEVAPSMTIVDLSIRGLSPGTYHATVREAGDISEGPESTGGIWEALKAKKEGKPCRGVFGTVEVGKGGVGSVFLDRPIQIWEMIGRSIVVARQQDGKFDKNDPDTLVGVVARSAGVWDNDKTLTKDFKMTAKSTFIVRTPVRPRRQHFAKPQADRPPLYHVAQG